MGRFFICSEASKKNSPSDTPSTADRKRAAVPALPTYREAFFTGSLPESPCTETSPVSGLDATSKDKSERHCKKWEESSENWAPVRWLFPSESMASSRARLVMLLEPGTFTCMVLWEKSPVRTGTGYSEILIIKSSFLPKIKSLFSVS